MSPTSLNDSKVTQELYCNDCDGYNLFSLTKAQQNKDVVVVCGNPKCDRKHPRRIREGQIVDNGYVDDRKAEEIILMPSAYNKEPRTSLCKKHSRDGAVVQSHDDFAAQSFLDESKRRSGWFGNMLGRNKNDNS